MVTKRRRWTGHAARFKEIITAGSFRIRRDHLEAFVVDRKDSRPLLKQNLTKQGTKVFTANQMVHQQNLCEDDNRRVTWICKGFLSQMRHYQGIKDSVAWNYLWTTSTYDVLTKSCNPHSSCT